MIGERGRPRAGFTRLAVRHNGARRPPERYPPTRWPAPFRTTSTSRSATHAIAVGAAEEKTKCVINKIVDGFHELPTRFQDRKTSEGDIFAKKGLKRQRP